MRADDSKVAGVMNGVNVFCKIFESENSLKFL